MPEKFSTAVLVAVFALALGTACSTTPSYSPPSPPGEVVSEERGEILAVHDITIDLAKSGSSGKAPGVSLPVRSPIGGMRVPVPIPGATASREVPGEEITVRTSNGRTIIVVQERSQPAMAPGERVRVLHERENTVTGIAKTRIERE